MKRERNFTKGGKTKIGTEKEQKKWEIDIKVEYEIEIHEKPETLEEFFF
jgi:hypothetical protein